MSHPQWHRGGEPRAYVYHTSEDTAKRASDALHRARLAISTEELIAGRFIAIRLSDGSCDDIVYDNRRDAILHQLHETQCLYMQIPLERIGPKAMDALLNYARLRYDAGYRAEPDGPPLFIPKTREDLFR